MKNSILSMAMILFFSSCAKEEFIGNKGKQTNTSDALSTSVDKKCTEATLISPKVDILMLWDNSSSFNIVTPETRASMGSLINSVSENFDYHILSVPLISTNPNTLHEGQLVSKDTIGLTSDALGIIRTKEQVSSSLAFTSSGSSAEPGVDRTIQVIQSNRANGIFRQDAYTMIVVISNEDDDSCESETPYASCPAYDWQSRMQTKINKLLCLRGNTYINCSSVGITNPINSTMMRLINISPLTACSAGANKINYRYKMAAKQLYEAPYTNNWPTSNDHISPDLSGAPDSYNLCTTPFSNIFDGVNSAIKQTLLRHKYDFWPVTGTNTAIDPNTLRVVRSDGKILTNRTGESNPMDGYQYVGARSNQNTRFAPTAGEAFTGKMIQLFGIDGTDKLVYPDCLTVTFQEPQANYGYIYLSNGTPSVPTIEVYLNNVRVPQSSTNGWDYMGIQNVSALDPALKIAGLPAGAPSGIFVRLNGSFKVSNSNANSFQVFYNSVGN